MQRTKYPNSRPSPEARYRGGLPTGQLLPSEITLVQEILVGRPYEDAVVNAGLMPVTKSKKERRAEVESYLSLDRVQNYLYQELLNRASRARITNDRILARLGELAFFDKTQAFHKDGSPKSIHEMDSATAAAIKEIEFKAIYVGKGQDKTQAGYIANIKFHDELPALQTLLKHNNPDTYSPNVQVNQYNQFNTQNNYYYKQVNLGDFSNTDIGYLKQLLGAEDEDEIAELMQIEEQVQEDQEQADQ